MITAETQRGHIYYRCTKRYTNCTQRYVREEYLAKQIKDYIQKVSLCDDWASKIISELKKDKNGDAQSSRPQQQNLQRQLNLIENKINKLIDMYLNATISIEEYKKKKEKLLFLKKDYQERLKDFAAGDNNWFEQARDFVTSLNRATYIASEGNLESQKEFLKKIGSNFILKERRLNFETEGTFRLFLKDAPYLTWRCVLSFVRTYFKGLPLK